MPEGDTIYRTARTLNKALGGKEVTSFQTVLAPLASVNDNAPLAGRIVERVESRGKWCLIFFSGDLILLTHMMMNGSWHIYRTGEKWQIARSRMRVVITCGDMQAIAFDVPVAEFRTSRSLQRSTAVGKLGPDILSESYSADRGVAALRERARTHPDDEVGVALMNQRVLAGIGNVYKSEVAFAAGVNPFRAMKSLSMSETVKMADAAQRLMRANIADGAEEHVVTYSGPRRTTHAMNDADRSWVYRREGQQCRRCGAPIQMRKQGDQARSTYWCPSCQPFIS